MLVYPARRGAFVADVIAADTLPPMGSPGIAPEEYVAYLRWIEDHLDFDTLVAGHGAIGSMQTVRQLRTYLEDLIAAVRTAQTAALADDTIDVADTARAQLAPRYATWEHFDRLDRNVAAVLRSQPSN